MMKVVILVACMVAAASAISGIGAMTNPYLYSSMFMNPWMNQMMYSPLNMGMMYSPYMMGGLGSWGMGGLGSWGMGMGALGAAGTMYG